MPAYRISGLVVEAEGELPYAATPYAGKEDAQVRIRRRSVPAHLDCALDRGPVWEMSSEDFLFGLPEIGRALASRGETLDAEAAEGAGMEEFAPFLLSTGWAAILAQRGIMTLHASVVADEQGAVVLCAASGVGKSTLAGAMCRNGAQFVCDDLAAITQDSSGRPVVWPDGRCLRLYLDSVEKLRLGEERRGEVCPGSGKYYTAPPGGPGAGGFPLSAIYFLRHQTPGRDLNIRQSSALQAVQGLLGHSYRKRLTLAWAAKGEYMATNAAVVNQMRVFDAYVPFEFDRLEESAAGLGEHGRGLRAPLQS